ncbi:hypothetical protein [Secundilactobacillus odoratitofui]|nr:hypothetical protein [Secundilactobacillus odoratitofui]
MAETIKQQEQAHLDVVIDKIKIAQTKSQERIDQAESDESAIRKKL